MKNSKNNSSDGRSVSWLASRSLIVLLLDRFSDFIYSMLCDSWLAKIFTAYSKEQEAYENGFLKNHFFTDGRLPIYVRAVRKFLSRSFENSLVLNKLAQLSREIITMPLKALGNFWFSFGIYIVIVYLLRLFIPVISAADVEVAIIGVVISISAIPMLLSRDNIAGAIGKSTLLGALFFNVFGYREESFRQRTRMSKLKTNLMIVLGMLLGVLTLAVHPFVILFIIGILIVTALIFSVPEIGIILSLFGLPFFSFLESPAITLGLVVFATAISYAVKLVRGKRILKFELIDLSVLLLAVVIFLSGVISAGGAVGYREALITCELMLGYFLIVNLIRTSRWVKRCVIALVCSGTAVSMIGIAQYIFGYLPTNLWLDTDYFYDIKGRVVSLFDNPNILAVYLVTVLPFALYALTQSRTGKARLLCGISLASIVLCIVLTWSRGAWIAAIFCILMFLLIYSKKTLRYLFLGCFFLPFIPFLLPQSVLRRFSSIGNMSDSSTMYRVFTWRGTVRTVGEYLMGGVGYGPTAFQSIYPQYAYAGIEAAEHSHNLFLQILVGIGISGFIVFALIIFLFLQMNLEYMKTTKDESAKLTVAACICAVLSMLLFGMFDYVWYSYRVFFLFWAVAAIACACVRIGRDEERRHQTDNIYNEQEIL